MKIVILAVLFFNIFMSFFLILNNLDSGYLISQNKSVKKQKIKHSKSKKASKTGSCSMKKCKIV